MTRVPFSVVIPARYASTRLPGKMLADIAGAPMVVRVAQRARDSGAARVCVATDHDAIREAVERHGFDAVMTRPDHASGTDRIAEVAERLALSPDAVVVNVQGDEPLVEPGLIRAVAAMLADTPEASIATACHAIKDAAEFFNPNVVKVVLDREGYARYFSRAPIPYARDWFAGRNLASDAAHAELPPGLPAYRHIGVYAYLTRFLTTYPRLAPSPLERFEALEQLRALWHGHAIAVVVRHEASHPGVDTQEELERVRAWFDHAQDKR